MGSKHQRGTLRLLAFAGALTLLPVAAGRAADTPPPQLELTWVGDMALSARYMRGPAPSVADTVVSVPLLTVPSLSLRLPNI